MARDSSAVDDAEDACLLRQLAEVEALQAMYCSEGEFQCTPEERAILSALMIKSAIASSELASRLPVLSFAITLKDTKVGGRPITVAASLPRGYPEAEPAVVRVECGGSATRQQHTTLNLAAQRRSLEMLGQEAVLSILLAVQELAWELSQSEAALQHEEAAREGEQPKGVSCGPPVVCRRVVWFHHIKSTQKRKCIVEWAEQLRVGGLCKPGFPGILVCEGEEEGVSEYIHRLQRLRWQAMSVRGEEREEGLPGTATDGLRRLPIGIEEFGEHGLSEVASRCEQAGLKLLFLTALKIHR